MDHTVLWANQSCRHRLGGKLHWPFLLPVARLKLVAPRSRLGPAQTLQEPPAAPAKPLLYPYHTQHLGPINPAGGLLPAAVAGWLVRRGIGRIAADQ